MMYLEVWCEADERWCNATTRPSPSITATSYPQRLIASVASLRCRMHMFDAAPT
jgi:hypothetical protein